MPTFHSDRDPDPFAQELIDDQCILPLLPTRTDHPIQNLGTPAVAGVASSFQTGEIHVQGVPSVPQGTMLGPEFYAAPNALDAKPFSSYHDHYPLRYASFADTGPPAAPSNLTVSQPTWEYYRNGCTNTNGLGLRHGLAPGRTNTKFVSGRYVHGHPWHSTQSGYARFFGKNYDAAALPRATSDMAFQESYSRGCFAGQGTIAPELAFYDQTTAPTMYYQDFSPSPPQNMVLPSPASPNMIDEDLLMEMLMQHAFWAENGHWPD